MIDISNLSKKYGKNKVLNNINLKLDNPANIYALLGKSGSGKSTLFNIIYGLDKEFDGSYKLFNENSQKIGNQKWNDYRSHSIKMVFQDFKLIEYLTVYENLYISGDYSVDEITSVLESMDIVDIKDEQVRNISGGQKQRVALGRSVLGNPKILLLDEPTGNLDGMTTEKIMLYIKKLRDKGILVFIITHDESVLEYVDVIYKIENGTIENEEYDISNDNSDRLVVTKKKAKEKKHLILYTMLNIIRNKKMLFFLSIPIVFILTLFMLSFTAFRAYSVDSFNEFFSGIDDQTLAFDVTTLNTSIVEDLNERNIMPVHDGERLGFSNEDFQVVQKLDHVEKVEMTLANIQSRYDYEGNLFEYRLVKDEVPDILKKDLRSLKEGEGILFPLTAQNVPRSIIEHYNTERIELIFGEFPADNSKEIVVPDLYAYVLSSDTNISNIINTQINLPVISADESTKEESYTISGIYQTNYQISLQPSYPIYVGYFDQIDQKDILNEEAFRFHEQSYQVNDQTFDYSQRIIGNFENFSKAVGTGFTKMVVVVDNEQNFEEVHNEIQEMFPNYQLTSQYDLRHGDLSDVYNALVKNLIVGSSIIAIFIGLIIIFLNKSYLYTRTKEFAILFCQGYSKLDICKIIMLENGIIFSSYYLISYMMATMFNYFILGNSSFGYLFNNLLSLSNIIAILILVVLMVLISILWSIVGIKNNNIIKLLKLSN